uniref:NADH:flavin oxidoreductase/NADH oxidase N-terminal domain-containing protein n=1 Tax=Bionectria ochroleuca TaxID=29856 RepID=A0A0B7KMN2_BIOOC
MDMPSTFILSIWVNLHSRELVYFCIETTAVEPWGRWSPYDVGLWNDDQIATIERIANFIHCQGSHMGVQIAHAGLTVQQIKEQIQKWKDTAVRAIKARINILEIHASHSALLNNFLSPVTNKRTDDYGGSFENRTRFLFEVIEAICQAIPASILLWVRLPATDWLEYRGEPSWDVESSIRLAKLLPAAGVDVLDVTTGGNAAAQRAEISQTFQADIAGRIRGAVRADGHNLLIAAVGLIRDGRFAISLVQKGEDPKANVVLVAR